MSIVRGWRLIFAFGLLAALFFAAGPRPADAAAPHITFAVSTVSAIHGSDGTDIPQERVLLIGSHVTPNGAVRISARFLPDDTPDTVQVTRADANGNFRVTFARPSACSGGHQRKVVALDGAPNTLANFVHPNVCPYLSQAGVTRTLVPAGSSTDRSSRSADEPGPMRPRKA